MDVKLNLTTRYMNPQKREHLKWNMTTYIWQVIYKPKTSFNDNCGSSLCLCAGEEKEGDRGRKRCTRKKERDRARDRVRDRAREKKNMCVSVWELSMVELSVFTKRHEAEPKNAIGRLIPKQMPEAAENVGAESADLGICFHRIDQKRTKWYFGNMDN